MKRIKYNFFISFGSCTLAQSKGNCGSFLDRDGIFVFFRASTLIPAPIQSLTEWADRVKHPEFEVDDPAPVKTLKFETQQQQASRALQPCLNQALFTWPVTQ
jgi:hypothetical protein